MRGINISDGVDGARDPLHRGKWDDQAGSYWNQIKFKQVQNLYHLRWGFSIKSFFVMVSSWDFPSAKMDTRTDTISIIFLPLKNTTHQQHCHHFLGEIILAVCLSKKWASMVSIRTINWFHWNSLPWFPSNTVK